jgi:hypothetical protein
MRIVFFLLLLILAACSKNSSDKESVEQVTSSLGTINKNLEYVNQKQGIVAVTSHEKEGVYNIASNRRIQTRISRNITLIDSVMTDNQNRLKTLDIEYAQSRNKISLLEKLVESMTTTIETKQHELDSMKTALKQSNLTITKLSDSLHTVYFLAAPQDSLKKWKIIERDGSVLGIIGGSNRLSDSISLSRFTRYDRTTAKRLPIPASIGHFELITAHNRKSYSLKKQDSDDRQTEKNGSMTYLVVNNPDKFWRLSRLLVIKLEK